ncbi:MAG TPA: EF-hand domain-containing protein [Burkholderiaceae bacterium]|nr:EF-hand domain-containing protein [Burkholderiaceae bacterium]
MNTRILVAAAFSAAFSVAIAAPTDAPAPRGFVALDKNGDGVISRDEAAGHPRLAESFDRIDTDKDGVLSQDELRAARQAHHAGRTRLDANGDGMISRDEAKAAPRLAANFDAIDTNKDGVLSRDELASWHKAQPHPRAAAQEPAPKQ